MITKERSKTIQNNGFSKELRLFKQTSRKIHNYGSRKERGMTSKTEKNYCRNKSKHLDSCIETSCFKKKITEGPYYAS